MGNPKFRLSEMIPNSWFPKLHHIGNPKSTPKPHQSPQQNHPPPSQKPPLSSIRTTRGDPSPEFHGELPLHPDSVSPPRKSYYFTREFHSKLKSFEFPEQSFNPPLKSARRSRRRRPPKSTTIRHSPVSSPDHRDPPSETFTQMVSLSSSSRNCRPDSSVIDEESDFVIEVDDKSLGLGRRKTGESVSSVELRPIRTERNKFSGLVKEIGGAQAAIDEPIKQKRSSPNCRGRRANGSLSVNVMREDSMASSVSFNEQEPEQGSRSKRSPSGSPRFKIRVHSPRIARRAQVHLSRGSLPNSVSKKGVSSKSLAVVKSSCDPQRDFRESMVEMIVENKITSAKDLEELLACYLSLNSDQYHDVIIEVFALIWFDLNNIRNEIKK